jgi:hypothetical protein
MTKRPAKAKTTTKATTKRKRAVKAAVLKTVAPAPEPVPLAEPIAETLPAPEPQLAPAGGIELNFSAQDIAYISQALDRFSSDRSSVIPVNEEERLRFQSEADELSDKVLHAPPNKLVSFSAQERQVAMAGLSSRIVKYRFAAWRCAAVGDRQNYAYWKNWYRNLERLRARFANEYTTGVVYPYSQMPEPKIPGEPREPVPASERLDDIHTSYPG